MDDIFIFDIFRLIYQSLYCIRIVVSFNYESQYVIGLAAIAF